jgi:hypothetical protein
MFSQHSGRVRHSHDWTYGEDAAMNLMNSRKPTALALAAAIAVGSVFVPGSYGTANAAPLSTNALALKEAAPSDVVDVRRWRRHRSGAAFAGLALGIIGAAIVAREYDRRHRRHYDNYYAPNYYHGGYAPHAYRHHYRHHYQHYHQEQAPTHFCHNCGVN